MLASIWESIKEIPVKIKGYLTDLGDTIINGLKALFVPDVEVLENNLDAMFDNISSQLGVQFDTFDRLFDREVAPEDVTEDIEIPGVGTVKAKLFDTEYLIDGVAYMRPYIRGFIVFLLTLFIWKQLMSFIGQDPGIAHNAERNYEEWKEKNG